MSQSGGRTALFSSTLRPKSRRVVTKRLSDQPDVGRGTDCTAPGTRGRDSQPGCLQRHLRPACNSSRQSRCPHPFRNRSRILNLTVLPLTPRFLVRRLQLSSFTPSRLLPAPRVTQSPLGGGMQDTYNTYTSIVVSSRLPTSKLAPAAACWAPTGEGAYGGSPGGRRRRASGWRWSLPVPSGGRDGRAGGQSLEGRGCEPAARWQGARGAAGTAEVRREPRGRRNRRRRGRSRARSCHRAAGPGRRHPPAAGHALRSRSPNNAPGRPARRLAARRPTARPGERGPEVSPRLFLQIRPLFVWQTWPRRVALGERCGRRAGRAPVGVPRVTGGSLGRVARPDRERPD